MEQNKENYSVCHQCGKRYYDRMTSQKLETRVGMMAVTILQEITKKYIKTHTINRKYVGRVEYLFMYKNNQEYLEREKRK